mgnify:FL=1|tara:strand:+ start:99 stop:437 length:339 start_codon:yes stop_codon:yes gene_type:complete
MSKTENQIQRQIKQYLDIVLLADSFWTAINPIPSKSIIAAANSKAMGMKAGVPDLLILHKGRTIWIEVKKEGGYLSRKQKEVHEKIAMAGGDVFTARSVEDVQKLLQKWGVI